MPQCRIKNISDLPVCITNEETGETFSVFPGYTIDVKSEWSDVKQAISKARVQVVHEAGGRGNPAVGK